MRDDIINLFHCKGKNFGDAVNPMLIERVFRINCKSVPKTEAELIAVGSILQRFTAENIVSSVQKMFFRFCMCGVPALLRMTSINILNAILIFMPSEDN